MRNSAILVLLLTSIIRVPAQEVPVPTILAECRFSDPHKITVRYSNRDRGYLLSTDERLISMVGLTVPRGDYVIFPSKDSRDHWILRIEKQGRPERHRALPPLPMSVTRFPLATNDGTIWFDHTGGSCIMHWVQKRFEVELSVEFTDRNSDLPVLMLTYPYNPRRTWQ